MIEKLTIKNFKSIKELELPCRKLNVFIGDPNSGKSNIIEALALQSQNAFHQELNKDIFRYKTLGDLFYDFNINQPIEVITNEKQSKLVYAIKEDGSPENTFNFIPDISKPDQILSHISHDGKTHGGHYGKTNVHYYEYKRIKSFFHNYGPHLSVPFGENLPNLLLANPTYKKWVSEFLQSKGLTLTLKPAENDMAVSKFIDGEIYSYPYFTLSETLQRIIFYNIALMSNKDSVLLFDEPESNTFPFYTKFLAERIALDESNQFFITTHNPYLLLSLIEKSKASNLNVCYVEMKDYQTKVTALNEIQISQVLDFNSDVFFNFNRIIEA
ncbi:MAG: AAA family ATPase [Bacteroidia bacterium]|nr:AAA family ATPase [Bacteroidia bacterium]